MNLNERGLNNFRESTPFPDWAQRINAANINLTVIQRDSALVLGSFHRYSYSEGSIRNEYRERTVTNFQTFLEKAKGDLPQAILLQSVPPKYNYMMIDYYYLPQVNKFYEVAYETFPRTTDVLNPDSPSFIGLKKIQQLVKKNMQIPGTEIMLREGIVADARYFLKAGDIAKKLDEILPEESRVRPHLTELLGNLNAAKEDEQENRKKAEAHFAPQIREGFLKLRDAVKAKFRLPDFIELHCYDDPDNPFDPLDHIQRSSYVGSIVFFDTKGGNLFAAPLITRKRFLRGLERIPDLTRRKEVPLVEWVSVARIDSLRVALLNPIPEKIRKKIR